MQLQQSEWRVQSADEAHGALIPEPVLPLAPVPALPLAPVPALPLAPAPLVSPPAPAVSPLDVVAVPLHAAAIAIEPTRKKKGARSFIHENYHGQGRKVERWAAFRRGPGRTRMLQGTFF